MPNTDSAARFLLAPRGVAPSTQSQVFAYSGGIQTFVVPAGVTAIQVDLWGAQGGGNGVYAWERGGGGGRVQATIPVTPGEVLNVVVGGKGEYQGTLAYHQGLASGYNGGGVCPPSQGTTAYAGGSGGGATDIRRGGTALANRIAVAGGGGGNASNYAIPAAGHGGGLVGANGYPGSGGFPAGQGGTQSAGGAGGAGADSVGSPGTLGQGGAPGSPNAIFIGGGGGGYYGGGGGGWSNGSGGYGQGGGGSSYTDPSAINVTHTQGFNLADRYIYTSAHGQATISWFVQGDLINGTADVANRTGTFSRATPDSAAVATDVAGGISLRPRTGDDTAPITDSAAQSSFQFRSGADTTTTTDSAVGTNLGP